MRWLYNNLRVNHVSVFKFKNQKEENGAKCKYTYNYYGLFIY